MASKIDCSLLLQRLQSDSFGVTISPSSNCGEPKLFSAFTFVDDNDMVQQIQNPADVTSTAQQALELWVDSLRTNGGSFLAEKSHWSPLVHKLQNNKWIIDKNAGGSDSITITTTCQQLAKRKTFSN